ncbi:hypothetical protein NBRC116583_32810 [Arenicella sp. 4NH20-0111]|uniref:BLUF domain-containing protein n=1 Tax=Arenicella sp. 4NH20-0111 TaxID=3127648 RepID=UPI00310982C7
MTLRTIVYVSSAIENVRGFRVPLGLSKICQVARKNNAETGITGILTFSKGHFLQIIEGDNDAIGHLFDAICKDKRHCDVVKILDTTTDTRSFTGWSMRLISAVGREPSFRKLMSAVQPHLNDLSEEKRRLFSIFYDGIGGAADDNDFEGKSLKLLAWPDFTQIKQSPTLIELCARLTSGTESYADILKSGDFGTKAQIDLFLRQFQQMDILVVSDEVIPEVSQGGFRGSQTFYNKMKNFLTLG